MRHLATTLALLGLLVPAGANSAVRRMRVPQGGISPDVAAGPTGNVVMVFAHGGDAWFAASKDGVNTFTSPTRLNLVPGTVLAGHERGPKIAIGKDETLHVVWMSAKSDKLYYCRRLPGGESFSEARNLLDAGTHLDGATVAADEKANVLVSWLDARQPPDLNNPLSLPVFAALSHDNGRTFSPNHLLEGKQPLRACSCCALKSIPGWKEDFIVGFRGAYNNIRDPFVARVESRRNDSQTTAVKIHDDEWRLDGCPMAGLFLDRGARVGEFWAAWMSQGHVTYAQSRDDGEGFGGLHSPRAPKHITQNHPIVLANAKGEVFLAWEEGRSIRWQITDSDGKRLDSGDAGTLPNNSKATGFVHRDGNFCVVF